MKHGLRIVALSVAAAALAACGDPAPKAPIARIEGAPIEGAPIDAPAAPVAPEATAPQAPVPPIGDLGDVVEPPAQAAAPVTPTAPPAPLTEGPVVPATTSSVPPTVPPSVPSSPTETVPSIPTIPPTTASQADKPTLPDRAAEPPKPAVDPAKPAVDLAKPAVDLAKSAVEPAKPAPDAANPAGKGFIPKGHKKGDVIEMTFEQLASFDFVPPPLPPLDSDAPPPDPAIALEASRKQIPAEIWELEGETVSVEGYMIPLEYADEGVKAFLISRHAMGCCFGVMPRAHELVECDLGEGKSTPYIGYLPVKITGVFHVGPKEGASTILSGIYRMDAPTVTIPKER